MADTADLLLEIFSEEMPSGLQPRAVADIAKMLGDGLADAGLSHAPIVTHTTPRRLVFCINDLPKTQPDVREEKKGPKVGSPEQAINGFLKGAGLNSVDECEIRETPKGDFYYAVIEKKGLPTVRVLLRIITHTINGYTWAKSMRFADYDFRWVRPLRHVLAVFGGEPLNRGIDMGNGQTVIPFGNTTVGHRFMGSSDGFIVKDFANYEKQLANHFVMVNTENRRAEIKTQLESHADKLGLTLVPDDKLLDEVTGLVEHVNVLVGSIDDEFMGVAQECIILSMRDHQKYFSFTDKNGKLAPYFATVANVSTADDSVIVGGNERVLKSRLADAKFFWDNDLKTPLAHMADKLGSVVFHAKLGSVADRIGRMGKIAEILTPHVDEAHPENVQTAVKLAKADLVSQMVYEFPELQGVMGKYYAQHQGYNDFVANAIAEHYSPLGPNDDCPTAPVSVVVALAEKLDTLVGFWLIDEKPTGSKDPYALRRACLGVIRLILENKITLDLPETIWEIAKAYGVGNAGDADDLINFFADRLTGHLKNNGIRDDVVKAVTALGMTDLLDTVNRATALNDFVNSPDGTALIQLYRRARNIVLAEEKKGLVVSETDNWAGCSRSDADNVLWEAFRDYGDKAIELVNSKDYTKAMEHYAQIKPAVDRFFNDVKINDADPDVRKFRLYSLGTLVDLMEKIADFSKIVSE